MMSSNVYQKKASDFQLLSLQGRDKECLTSLFSEHKASQQLQDATCYLVFNQQKPFFYSLKKHLVSTGYFSGSDSEAMLPHAAAASDSAIAEVEVDFPLALYRSALRHDIFNMLVSLKEQCGHYTLNLRLPLDEIASEYELNDIAKLCIVAGADNLTLSLTRSLDSQQEARINLLANLLKRFFVSDSCGLIFSGLTTLPVMQRISSLAIEILGEDWVDNASLKFEC
ncbi:hypothetical protein BIT28_22275 [Photobacterium proteolyticum]|uniref:EAL domain-containing protein n=1 Tax=Photobacterium proteolyticum TaxID=1903952 RepID=A0A1Q9GGC5_9GAMM|nr:hypothetical protein [Photobacterium proteolyticum]OLQ73453.1 hypothetical protein BIT28_22275 [Photobacterium proteolyticum]